MPKHLSEDNYKKQFEIKKRLEKPSDIQKNALERAWKNRDFEIELYWKRATYFWGFIAATFAGYFAVLAAGEELQQGEYILICLGFIFSVAWYFVNIGSKKWFVNWEKHIDMLEDEITGPLYKTVLDMPAYSVTKVNLKVSFFVVLIWVVLALSYWFENLTFQGGIADIDFITIGLTSISITFWSLMWKQKSRSNRNIGTNEKGVSTFSFSKREFEYEDPNNDNKESVK